MYVGRPLTLSGVRGVLLNCAWALKTSKNGKFLSRNPPIAPKLPGKYVIPKAPETELFPLLGE
jgi:hypothetical protein